MVIPCENGREDPAHHKHFKNGTHGADAGGVMRQGGSNTEGVDDVSQKAVP